MTHPLSGPCKAAFQGVSMGGLISVARNAPLHIAYLFERARAVIVIAIDQSSMSLEAQGQRQKAAIQRQKRQKVV